VSAHDDYTRGYLAACERIQTMAAEAATVLESAVARGGAELSIVAGALRGVQKIVQTHAEEEEAEHARVARGDDAPSTGVTEGVARVHHEHRPCRPYSAEGHPLEVLFGRFATFAEALAAARADHGTPDPGARVTDGQGREVYSRLAGNTAETFTLPPV
jgi:hypothetical protein